MAIADAPIVRQLILYYGFQTKRKEPY